MVMMLFLLAYLMFTILSMVHEYAYMLWIYLEIGLLTQMRFVILSLLNEYDDVLVEIMLFKVCNVQFIDKLTLYKGAIRDVSWIAFLGLRNSFGRLQLVQYNVWHLSNHIVLRFGGC